MAVTMNAVKVLALIALIVLVIIGVLFFIHQIAWEYAIFILWLTLGIFYTAVRLVT